MSKGNLNPGAVFPFRERVRVRVAGQARTVGLLFPGPLPVGALPKKSVLSLIYCRFNVLNLSIPLSILIFWAKPPVRERAG
jgi:hypothetical protein